MSRTNINNYNTFGEALAKALTIRHLSNREFSNKIKVHESQVSNWITGRTIPYERTQRKIISALGLSIVQDGEYWIIEEQEHSQDSVSEPKVVYADQVVLPKGGQISQDLFHELLGQIESIARILKDSLE